jgi:hypothetical protein
VRGEEDADGRRRDPHFGKQISRGELVLCMSLRVARGVDIAMVAKVGGSDALYIDR